MEAPIDSKTDDTLVTPVNPGGDGTPVTPVTKNDFTGITFNNGSFVYDGTAMFVIFYTVVLVFFIILIIKCINGIKNIRDYIPVPETIEKEMEVKKE